MSWPFRHLKQSSAWPLQGVVVALAGAILKAPPEIRSGFASKTLERAFRIGARLAREFEVDPVAALRIAQRQIEREIPGAADAIGHARAEEYLSAAAVASAAFEK